MSTSDSGDLEGGEPDGLSPWQREVYEEIRSIPRGHLATYGSIARRVNEAHGRNVTARNVAWLRRRLYVLLTHDTDVPLHRVAKKGDVHSLADSPRTKAYNDRLRGEEGSLRSPQWW